MDLDFNERRGFDFRFGLKFKFSFYVVIKIKYLWFCCCWLVNIFEFDVKRAISRVYQHELYQFLYGKIKFVSFDVVVSFFLFVRESQSRTGAELAYIILLIWSHPEFISKCAWWRVGNRQEFSRFGLMFRCLTLDGRLIEVRSVRLSGTSCRR